MLSTETRQEADTGPVPPTARPFAPHSPPRGRRWPYTPRPQSKPANVTLCPLLLKITRLHRVNGCVGAPLPLSIHHSCTTPDGPMYFPPRCCRRRSAILILFIGSARSKCPWNPFEISHLHLVPPKTELSHDEPSHFAHLGGKGGCISWLRCPVDSRNLPRKFCPYALLLD